VKAAAKPHSLRTSRPGRLFWQRFRTHRRALGSLYFLALLAFIALMADFLANDKPLYCRYEGKTYFPVLREYGVGLGLAEWPEGLTAGQWRRLEYERVWWPPIPYAAQTLDGANMNYRSPLGDQQVPSRRFRHWLGTDKIGRDLAAGLIAGTRIALLVGLIAMSIAGSLGIFLGLLAGYYGDQGFRRCRAWVLTHLLFLPLGLFWVIAPWRAAYLQGQFGLRLLISVGLGLAAWGLGRLLLSGLKRWPAWERPLAIPLDGLIMRVIEIFQSIPTLLLLLGTVAVLPKPSVYYVMILIGLLSWTTIARFVRAEVLRIRKMDYVDAARAMGFSDRRILLRHVLPNTLTPVFVALAFGFAGAILLEAFLSFLGIGVAPEQVTWGQLLQLSRSQFSAWWLALFPGLAIFSTVLAFNLVGEGLSDALDPER